MAQQNDNSSTTKCAKIRELHEAGHKVGAIAKALSIRYQHARNEVLRYEDEKALWAKEGQQVK